MARVTGDAILAVSDCAFRRLLMKSVFERHRCLVVLASNAARAESVLAALHPDAIVSDLPLTVPSTFVGLGSVERFFGRAGGGRYDGPATEPKLVAKALAQDFRLYLADPVELPLLRRVVQRLGELDEEPVLAALLRR